MGKTNYHIMVQVFTALVAFLVVSVSLCEGRRIRRSKFEESDLAEISGIVGYMVARFGRNQDTHTSRRIGDEWKNSAFVSTVFNVFTDKRVLTNEMVKEAIGHSCEALETLHMQQLIGKQLFINGNSHLQKS